ncbi:MAG TPA: head-tail adaptor protein [Spirochaetota bacterium]|nr:head-tail adaptor protein [Spirochaetota bacterium]
MKPDLYNKDVTTRRATIGQDANGQPTETWADYLTFRAHVYAASAYQKFSASKATDFFTHRMLCDNLDIITADTAVIDGDTYRVVAVNRPPFTAQLSLDLERTE